MALLTIVFSRKDKEAEHKGCVVQVEHREVPVVLHALEVAEKVEVAENREAGTAAVSE